MFTKRSAIMALLSATAAASACGREATAPVFTPDVASGQASQVPIANANWLGLSSSRKRSGYSCTVTAQAPDGQFRNFTMWLHFPERMKSANGGSQVIPIRWQPTSGQTAAGANCRIPNTPAAQQALLNDLLFIDPKTMKAFRGLPPGELDPSDRAQDCCTQIAGVIVTAPYNWGSGSFGGGFGQPDDPSVNSVTPWDNSPYYAPPPPPCDGYDASGVYQGAGVLADNAIMTAAQACPETWFESLCIDLYIADSSAFGLRGDGRGPNPDAPPNLSRAQLIVPVDTRYISYRKAYVSPTCWAGTTNCYAPLDSTRNQVTYWYYPMGIQPGQVPDSIVVLYRLENSITTAGGWMPGPVIDGHVTFVPGSDGRMQVANLARDAFPTMSIYSWTPDVNIRRQLAQRAETNPTALIGWTGQQDTMSCVVP
jgi:hypothetical protein